MLVILIGLMVAMFWCLQPSANGRRIRFWLVERPAELLSRMTFGRFAFAVFAVIAVAAAIHFFQGDGVRLLGSGLWEGASWFIAFDVGTYLDVFGIVLLLGASRYARTTLKYVQDLIARAGWAISRAFRGQVRHLSNRARRRATRTPRNDDPDASGWPGLVFAG